MHRVASVPRTLLFVCAANMDRSPTAERLCAGLPGITVRSAGVASDARVPLDDELLTWAGLVVTMEPWQSDVIRKRYPDLSVPIFCLEIEDRYSYMSAELIAILHERLPRVLSALDVPMIPEDRRSSRS